ncbi:hypothetical protein PV10_06093 [Exophiala mesophila]|uniref:Uncharacterized protein n=1 Tax=Exophiala mesophila TaxID=212818 RepID=A0A0D1WR47_EXOME|nr:uncharacterized protein PV10_06093 [Exophiala mesophila]KIV91570.1 hypothetical protein PV10_06093 [Exophiala mesophila]
MGVCIQIEGAFAEYLKVDGDLAWKVPAGIKDEEAVTYGVSAVTAAYGLSLRLGLEWPDDPSVTTQSEKANAQERPIRSSNSDLFWSHKRWTLRDSVCKTDRLSCYHHRLNALFRSGEEQRRRLCVRLPISNLCARDMIGVPRPQARPGLLLGQCVHLVLCRSAERTRRQSSDSPSPDPTQDFWR